MLHNMKKLKSTASDMLKRCKEIPTHTVPSYWVKRKLSPAGYSVKKKLKLGLQCQLADAGAENSTLIFQWLDEDTKYVKDDVFDVLTGNGRIRFYNYRMFFQTLSGMVLDEETVASHELLNLMIARLPRSVVDVFGWFAPIDFNASLHDEVVEDLNTVTIALRIVSKDISIMTCIEADKMVLLRILDSPGLSPFTETNTSEEQPLKMTIPCIIGSSVITADMLRSLDVGDVLMLQDTNIDVDGLVNIQIAGRELQAVASEESSTDFIISDDQKDIKDDSSIDIESAGDIAGGVESAGV